MRHVLRTLPFALLALALAACGSEPESGSPPVAEAGQESAPAVARAPRGPAAATVEGETITIPEVRRVATNLKRQSMEPDESVEGETYDERIYRTAMDRLIEQLVIQVAAQRDGINITDPEVQAGLQQVMAQAGGQENFNQLLAVNGSTLDDVVRDVRASMYVRRYFEKVVGAEGEPEVTEAEIEAFYNENADQFGPRPTVHARHILIMTRPDMDDMAKAEALNKINQAKARVDGGEDFATVANEVTEDPTNAGKGGDLDWFMEGDMVGPFNDTVFAMEAGQVSDVVETQFGYHIIKLEEKKTTEGRSLEELTPQIRISVMGQKAEARFRDLVANLRNDMSIEIKPVTPEAVQGI